MSFLLDTNVVIRMLVDPTLLSPELLDLLERTPRFELKVSSLVLYEISIKATRGHLPLDPQDVQAELQRLRLTGLPFAVAHAIEAGRLPPIHKDPFDRGMLAQAMVEGLTLLTCDRLLADYPVATLVL